MKKAECELVFLTTTIDDKGSPHTEEHKKLVICDERKQFSARYYNEQERSMRGGLKLSVASYYVTDDLKRVVYKGKTYDVKNIMSDNIGGERYTVLDCQEVKKS